MKSKTPNVTRARRFITVPRALLAASLLITVVVTVVVTSHAMPPGHPPLMDGEYATGSRSLHNNSKRLPHGQGPDHGALSNTVVATVNGRNILLPDLMKMMKHMTSSSFRGKLSAEQAGELKKRAIDRLIFQELIFQSAISKGVNISDAEIDATVARMEQNAGGSRHYREYLASRGMTPAEARDEVERYLYIQKTLEAYIGNRADVSDAELQEAYKEHIDEFTQIEKAEVDDVVFFLDPARPDSVKRAEAVRKELLDICHGDTSKLARDGTFAIRRIKMDGSDEPDLYRQIKELEAGEISPVIIADSTLHIVKMINFTPWSVRPLAEVSPVLRAEISNRKREKIMDELATRLRSEADIKIYDITAD